MKQSHYKGFYNISTNEAKTEATVLIYGVIGGFDFEKWEPINTANKFIEDFKEVEKTANTIHVKINSPGGSIWDGLPIYNTLKNSKKEIKTYVDGIAYSMASLIALAGDTVYGYSNSMLMFHNGSTYAFGNAKTMRKEADTLDSYDEALGSIIQEKLNISAEEVKEKYLNYDDNYFVGNEAKTVGFFDEIITSKKVDIPEDVKNMSPQDLIKHYSAMNFEKNIPPKQNKQPLKTKNMSKTYPKIEAVLNKKFEEGEASNGILLTDEEADAVNSKINELEITVTNATTAKESAEEKVTNLEAAATEAITANQTIVDQVNESLGLEEDAKATDVETAFAALNAKIVALGEQPGETHTTVKKKEDLSNEHSYIDFDSPLYQPNK